MGNPHVESVEVTPTHEDTDSETVPHEQGSVVDAIASAEPERLGSSEASEGDAGEGIEAPAREPPTEEGKLVTLWRLAPRQAHVRPSKPARAPREWTIAPPSRPERAPANERPAHAPPASATAARSVENEERPRRSRRPDGPRPQRAQDMQPASSRPAPNVDKDSPFYKLMALREQLTKK